MHQERPRNSQADAINCDCRLSLEQVLMERTIGLRMTVFEGLQPDSVP